MKMYAPSSTNSLAVASAMPDVAAVMTATLPSSLPICPPIRASMGHSSTCRAAESQSIRNDHGASASAPPGNRPIEISRVRPRRPPPHQGYTRESRGGTGGGLGGGGGGIRGPAGGERARGVLLQEVAAR